MIAMLASLAWAAMIASMAREIYGKVHELLEIPFRTKKVGLAESRLLVAPECALNVYLIRIFCGQDSFSLYGVASHFPNLKLSGVYKTNSSTIKN